MVFLPCPKFNHGGDNSSGSEDNVAVTKNNGHYGVPETNSHLPANDSERDRQALEDIFRPSMPQSSRGRVRVSLRSRSSFPKRKPMGRIKSRVSIVSMKALSNKLRRRFSRDVDLAKNAKATIRVTADIFENGTGSVSYDGDAQGILTPQLAAADDSPYAITKCNGNASQNAFQTPRRTSTVLPNEVDGSTMSGHSPTVGVGTPMSIKHGLADVNDSRVAEAQEDHTATNTPRESVMAASNAASAPVTGSKAESPAYFTPPDHRSPAPDGRHYSKPSESPHDGSPRPSMGISTRSLYLLPNHPPPPIPDRHPARRASIHGSPVSRSNSVYSERPPSFLLASTETHQSTPGAERKASIRSRVVSGLADIPEAGKMTPTNDQDEGNSKKDAQPSGPIVPVPQSLGRSHTLHVPKRNASVGRQSRFREDFDLMLTDEGPVNLSRSKTTREHVRKSSEGWLSGGRRLGYGYDFVSRPPTDASPSNGVTGVAEGTTNNEQRDAKGKPVEATDLERVDPVEPLDNEDIRGVTLTALPGAPIDPAESGTEQAPVKRSFSLRAWARLQAGRKERHSSAAIDNDSEPVTSDIDKIDETPKPRKSKGLFHSLSLSRGKKIFQHRQPSSSDSLPGEIVELGRTTREEPEEDAMPNPYTHLTENPNGHSESRDVSLAHVRGSSTYSPLLRPAGYDGPRDSRPHPLSSLDGSAENQDPLAQLRTADSWSQIYQDCLPDLTMSEESEAIIEGKATFEMERDAGKKSMASALESGMTAQEDMAGFREPRHGRQGNAKESLR